MDGLRLVKRLAKDMEEMFHKKAQAMKVGWVKMNGTPCTPSSGFAFIERCCKKSRVVF